MKQHNLRMSDELFAAVNDAAGDVPRNTWIVRALESALSDGKVPSSLRGARVPAPPRSASTRMSPAMARQAKLNAEKAGKR